MFAESVRGRGGSLSPPLRAFSNPPSGAFLGLFTPVPGVSFAGCFFADSFSSYFFFRRSAIPWQLLVLLWSLECLELQAQPFSRSRRGRSPFLLFFLCFESVIPSAGSASVLAPSFVFNRRDALSRCSSLQRSARPAFFGAPRSSPLMPL